MIVIPLGGMSELVLLGLTERAEAVLSSTPEPHRGHYSVLSVVADRERLIRSPGCMLLTGVGIEKLAHWREV
jgi:hypothetical protein